MKFNEYDIALKNEGLELKIIHRFNKDIDCIDKAMRFLLDQYKLLCCARERAFILSYDVQGNFTGFMQISIGDHKDVQVSLNSIFKYLLLNNAYGCIFVHNHIKGCVLEPSANDWALHYQILSLCEILNIELFANIILQNYSNYYNMLTNSLEELT